MDIAGSQLIPKPQRQTWDAICDPEVLKVCIPGCETMERISHALDELPPKLRSVVVLKDVYDLSHEAIADELGITVAAAKVRLHRGRRKLRDVLYEEGAEAHAV